MRPFFSWLHELASAPKTTKGSYPSSYANIDSASRKSRTTDSAHRDIKVVRTVDIELDTRDDGSTEDILPSNNSGMRDLWVVRKASEK